MISVGRCDRDFKIIQFTDVHYADGNEVDAETIRVMERILEAERPDFVVLTGDTVYGPENERLLPEALAPVVKSKIPWTFTFGNHDTEWGAGKEEIFRAAAAMEGCMAWDDKEAGTGTANHYLEVEGNEGTGWLLFFMDSGMYNEQIGGYAYLSKEQIAWFRSVIRRYEKKWKDFNALVFLHIALPEYREVWDMEVCFGDKLEMVGCSRVNSGFFTAMLEEGHVKGVFAGHDHLNDYIGELYGIRLAYGRASGYNTYSRENYKKGARVIVLPEDGTDFKTWERLEDGSISYGERHEPEMVREEE